jgi:hypothetical protein
LKITGQGRENGFYPLTALHTEFTCIDKKGAS